MFIAKEENLKAAYLPNGFSQNTDLTINGDLFHHLVNVLRVKQNDEVALLDGMGLKGIGQISVVGKRDLTVRVKSVTLTDAAPCCELLIFTPKKDALESMIKAATELGVRRVYLYRGDYSQEKLPETNRVQAILQSAMEQSNNPWKPEIIHCLDLIECPLNQFDQIHFMDVGVTVDHPLRVGGRSILVIGPEGGFSDKERELFKSFRNIQVVSLPTPILRAPTAMIAGLGWWYAQSLKP